MVQVCVSLGIAADEITTASVAGKMLQGDIVGWQGAFVPQSRTWYDILFHLTRPGAEEICRLVTGRRGSPTEAELLTAMLAFLGNVQATHRKLFETGGPGVVAASTTLFSPPLAEARPSWIDEAGIASDSQIVQFPHVFLVCDFHASPGVARIKPVASVVAGDVVNEPIAAKGQNRRIPLANRGVVFNPERLGKIIPQLENSQTLWVIEPSLLTRRLHRN